MDERTNTILRYFARLQYEASGIVDLLTRNQCITEETRERIRQYCNRGSVLLRSRQVRDCIAPHQPSDSPIIVEAHS